MVLLTGILPAPVACCFVALLLPHDCPRLLWTGHLAALYAAVPLPVMKAGRDHEIDQP
jgi:hypothetical protein